MKTAAEVQRHWNEKELFCGLIGSRAYVKIYGPYAGSFKFHWQCCDHRAQRPSHHVQQGAKPIAETNPIPQGRSAWQAKADRLGWPDEITHNPNRVFRWAAKGGNPAKEEEFIALMQDLLKQHPEVLNSASTDDGDTALHRAAKDHEEIFVQFLLTSGADITARNFARKLPRDLMPSFDRLFCDKYFSKLHVTTWDEMCTRLAEDEAPAGQVHLQRVGRIILLMPTDATLQNFSIL